MLPAVSGAHYLVAYFKRMLPALYAPGGYRLPWCRQLTAAGQRVKTDGTHG